MIAKFAVKIEDFEARKVDEKVMTVIKDEMQKLSSLERNSPEFNVTRSYLDWLTSVPWKVLTEDRSVYLTSVICVITLKYWRKLIQIVANAVYDIVYFHIMMYTQYLVNFLLFLSLLNILHTLRLNLKIARTTLDADHFGLDEIKKRILEFIAVGKLRGTVAGKIICFVGPPGVG